LDLSAYTTPIFFTLASGTAPNILGGFSNIQELILPVINDSLVSELLITYEFRRFVTDNPYDLYDKPVVAASWVASDIVEPLIYDELFQRYELFDGKEQRFEEARFASILNNAENAIALARADDDIASFEREILENEHDEMAKDSKLDKMKKRYLLRLFKSKTNRARVATCY